MKYYKDETGQVKVKYEYLDHLSMNELRAILYEAGVPYPIPAKREDLVKLIEKKHLYWKMEGCLALHFRFKGQ